MVLFQHPYHPNLNITIYDLIFVPVIILLVYLFAKNRQDKKLKTESHYKYFANAITLRVFVSVLFALTVLFFYPGDSMAYFRNVNSFNNLFFIDPSKYFDILLHGNRPEYWSYFNQETGYPAYYMWRDPNAIFVARLYSPLLILTYKNYIISSVITGLIGFSGLWKLYELFCKLYSGMEGKFAIAILFFPSVLFWSSGLMKDTITISAMGWIVYSFYNFAIIKKFKIKYLISLITASVLIINIKAYIFVALLPGLFIWFFFDQIKRIKSNAFKFIVAPLLIALIGFLFLFFTSSLSTSLGVYGDINRSIEQAQTIQQDLTRAEQYGENYYDIGEITATPMGIISLAPIAIVSGIFRPFIWEASNPFILLAGLENTFLIVFLVYLIFKTGLLGFFRKIMQDPILIFSFCFVILFGFGIGLASANFGALVRYKIPLLPLFISILFIINNGIKKAKVKT